MGRVHRPAIHITPDDVSALLLALDKRVVAGLASRLAVIEIEEEDAVAPVRLFVVDHGGLRVVPVVRQQKAATALAGVEIASESLEPDAVRAVPSAVAIKVAVLLARRERLGLHE